MSKWSSASKLENSGSNSVDATKAGGTSPCDSLLHLKSRGRLWRSVRSIAGVTTSEFDEYFEGCGLAVVILFQTVMKFRAPVTLNDLRSVWPAFHPPQGFRYLTPTQQRFVLRNLQSNRANVLHNGTNENPVPPRLALGSWWRQANIPQKSRPRSHQPGP